MNKQEFIDFLKEKSKEKDLTHWRKVYQNSDDYWELFIPCVDWMPDFISLDKEGVVKMECDRSLFDNSKVISLTYEEFKKIYS